MTSKTIELSLLTTPAYKGIRHKPAFTHGIGRLGHSDIRLYLEDQNFFGSTWSHVATVWVDPTDDVNKLSQLVVAAIMSHENHTLVEVDYLAKWYKLPE